MSHNSPQPATTKAGPARSRKLLVGGAALISLMAVVSLLLQQRAQTFHLDDKSRAFDRDGRNAPYVVTGDAVAAKMVEMANLTADDVVYDLGCGDGRLVIAAAKAAGCRGIGFEIDPARVAEARENVRREGLEHLVEIREQDIFTLDLSEADVILMYLLPWMNRKLIPQFQQMRPGSRIISHDFGLGDITDVQPEATVGVEVNPQERHFVHRWIVPLPIRQTPSGAQ